MCAGASGTKHEARITKSYVGLLSKPDRGKRDKTPATTTTMTTTKTWTKSATHKASQPSKNVNKRTGKTQNTQARQKYFRSCIDTAPPNQQELRL